MFCVLETPLKDGQVSFSEGNVLLLNDIEQGQRVDVAAQCFGVVVGEVVDGATAHELHRDQLGDHDQKQHCRRHRPHDEPAP